MNQNVFSLTRTNRYYLKHPIKFFKELYCNCRAAYMRISHGWCARDCYEFGYWFLDVIPDMLDYLADNGCGYPGDDRFPTPESWSAHLHSIANLLKNARDEVRDKKNEYTEAHEKELEETGWPRYTTNSDGNKTVVISDSPIFNNYHNRDLELAQEQDVMIEEALKLLAETPLKALWD